MRYYAYYDNTGTLMAIGTGEGYTEISEEEYNQTLSEIFKKNEFTEKLYTNKITIDGVPDEWRDEILSRVERLVLDQGPYEDPKSISEYKEEIEVLELENAELLFKNLTGEEFI
jgi:hypothetical protein